MLLKIKAVLNVPEFSTGAITEPVTKEMGKRNIACTVIGYITEEKM
jgi:hypothetical protein